MLTVIVLSSLFACFVSAWFMTALVRRYALSRNVLDVPNERSSHTRPTPRGGGVAFVVAFLVWGSALIIFDLVPHQNGIAILGSGLVVAGMGFLDDHRHIAARWRLLVHFLATAWALYWIGGVPPLEFMGISTGNGVLAVIPLAVFVVWLLNLYNFMDGIDGIASVEAITVSVGGAVLYGIVGHPDMAIMPMLLAASVAGFLIWNFPPARIFMGDAGSGFLGIVLAVMALQAGWLDSSLFVAWIIMLGVFIVDATFTLIRRLCRGERVYEAHKSHAYQVASRKFSGHRRVTLAVLAINVMWLWPIAYLLAMHRLSSGIALLLAYVPLIVLVIVFQAGRSEKVTAV